MEIIKEATLEDSAQLTDLLTTLFTQEADFQPVNTEKLLDCVLYIEKNVLMSLQ